MLLRGARALLFLRRSGSPVESPPDDKVMDMKKVRMGRSFSVRLLCVALFSVLAFTAVGQIAAETAAVPENSGQPSTDRTASAQNCSDSVHASPFIPLDSWIYPAVLRLYSLGFADSAYLGMRPWTRASLNHMLQETGSNIESADQGPAQDEAEQIYNSLLQELRDDAQDACAEHPLAARAESAYTIVRGISGTPLRDSFHLGSTIVNDFGRPYENGANNYSGASGYATAGRFVLYARGEFEGVPSATGYSSTLSKTLSNIDQATYLNTNTGLPYNQATIPAGSFGTITDGRVMEAYVAMNLRNHSISFGKQDEWMGPGVGGAMAYSNNAEGIYAFHVNRTEPLLIPGLSRLTGPFRYEFLVGSLKGHTDPNDPWVHVEKISFKPTRNLEVGFERTVIWGGAGHEPITLHTFLKSFFSTVNVTSEIKNSNRDPGARFGAFDFTYRVPYLRNWLTLYADSEGHDDVSPISAPRRAAYRPGLYLSHVPGVSKLDLRVEGVSTDPPVARSNGGIFMYWEYIQKQGYTNKGQLFGDWIGREDKGGQAWVTYHLSGKEWIQASVRHQKAAKDFIPGGTTLNDIDFQVVKRLGKDFEVNGQFSYEHWKAPVYLSGQQTVTTTTVQLTWYPKRKASF
jgi:hypothetical protein